MTETAVLWMMVLTQAAPNGIATLCNAPGFGMQFCLWHRNFKKMCWVLPASIGGVFSVADTSSPPETGLCTAPSAALPSSGKRPVNGYAVTEVGCNALEKKDVAAQSLFAPCFCTLVSFVQKPGKRVLVRYRGYFHPISKPGAITTIYRKTLLRGYFPKAQERSFFIQISSKGV